MYWAQRQQVVGSGYAQEVRWVNTPLCKACGERVDIFLSEKDKSLFVQWYNRRSNKGKFLVVSLVVVVCALAFFGVAWMGYDMATEIWGEY